MKRSRRSILSWLFNSKYGKILPLLALSLMMVTASAAVFQLYYTNTTATVRANDVILAKGTDASASCTAYPCATETVASTSDFATISLSFAKSAVNTPQPATYYTNLTVIRDVSNSHTISAVKVTPTITATSPSDFGSITVYYCTTQTNTPATTCTDSLSITSTSSTGNIFSGSDALTAGTNRYIEVVAYAGSGATAGDTVSFNISVQWS